MAGNFNQLLPRTITKPYNSYKTTERVKKCTHKSFYDTCQRDVAPGSDKLCIKHFNERLARFGIKAVGNE